MEVCSSAPVYSALGQLGISYRNAAHPAAFSMDDLAGVEALLNAPFCKNLFLCNRQKTEFFLLLIREDKRFRSAEVSKKLNRSRLSFGDENMLLELLGVRPGAITPLGLLHDGGRRVGLVIDRDLLALPEICVHPCVNTESLALSVSDLLQRFFPFTGHEPRLLTIGDGPDENGQDNEKYV